MRTFPTLIVASALAAYARNALADPFHLADDPRFSFGLRAGFLHADDGLYEATWIRPLALDAGWSLLTREEELFFSRLEVYGLATLDLARLSYHETPEEADANLVGIHRADIAAEPNLSLGIGGRLTLYGGRRLHLHLYGEVMAMPRPSSVEIGALEIDVGGLRIDVAKAAREHADVSLGWNTESLGLTAAWSFDVPCGRRLTPYASFGLLRYQAVVSFEIDPELTRVLEGFNADPGILRPRTIAQTKPFGTLGARWDLTDGWSLEADTLVGHTGDGWIVSVNAGVVFRFETPAAAPPPDGVPF
jgi:hypothetical protein